MRRNQKYSVVGPAPNGPSLQVLTVLLDDWGWGATENPREKILDWLVALCSAEEEAELWT